MQDLVTPDTLDPLDRRVYDLAIQHIPLAEMAVRLGVPVSQADEKLQRLFSRLGVTDRAALRELAEPPTAESVKSVAVPETSEAEYVIGAETTVEAPSRVFSRRRLLGAGAVAGVVGLSGLGALALQSRRSAPGDLPTQRDVQLGSNTPPGKPFPLTPGPGVSHSLVTKIWASGAPIDWLHGIFFMKTGDGRIDGYQFLSLGGGSLEWSQYRPHGDGRLFSAVNDAMTTGSIVDRDTLDVVWSWDSNTYRLLAAHGERSFGAGIQSPVWLLFESAGGSRTFHFVRLPGAEAVEIASFASETPPGIAPEVIKEPGGKRIAVFHGPFEAPEIGLFDISTGERLNRYAPYESTGPKDVALSKPFQRLTNGFLARWGSPANGRGDIPARHYSWPISWDGDQIFPKGEEPAASYCAPNGITKASETGIRTTPINNIGTSAGHWWPSVEVRRGSSLAPDFRLRSAALEFGDALPANRWLADGTGFVAAIRGPGPNDHAYAIVSGPESPVTYLPQPRAQGNGTVSQAAAMRAAVPHPTDPDLFSYGRVGVFDLGNGVWFPARISDTGSGPDHIDPWETNGQEMVFALPHGGHGGERGPTMLAPKFEEPPFDDDFEFVVQVDPTGLNLREQADVTARSLRVLHDGDRLTLAQSTDPSLGPTELSVQASGSATWLYVQTEDGLEGWVNSTWVAWP